MEILYILLVLLAVSRLFGELGERVGLPALIGELIAGIVIGIIATSFPETFPVFVNLTDDEVFTAITDLGIFFLMLMAGIEIHPKKFFETSKKAIWVALGGLLLPLLSGFAFGWFVLPDSEYKGAQVLFLAVSLSITAVPVAAKVLMDLKKLNTPAGQTIMTSAVIDDILSLVLLAILTSIAQAGKMPGFSEFILLLGKIAVFLIIAIGFGRYIFPWLKRIAAKYIIIEKFEFSLLLIVGFGYAVLAELLEMHFIIGAFAAGLFFVRRKDLPKKVHEEVKEHVDAVTTGFLAPIFFTSIGLQLNLTALWEVPFFVLALILIAVLGKFIGAGWPAWKFSGLSKKEAAVTGFGMVARGAVELIIAGVVLRSGILDQPDDPVVRNLFSAVVIMAIITTLITPIALRIFLKK